jgi:hypothetical protein
MPVKKKSRSFFDIIFGRNKKFWAVVIGYSAVGIFSFLAGAAYYFAEFTKDLNINVQIIYISLLTVFGMLLFGYSYTKVYFPKYLQKESVKKIKSVCVCAAVAFFLGLVAVAHSLLYNAGFSGSGIKSAAFFVAASLIVIFIYFLSFSVYTKYKPFINNAKLKDSTSYNLVYPSVLIVGVSYYIGASVCPLMNCEWQYLMPYPVFIAFFFFLGRVNKKKDIVKKNTLVYGIFTVILMLSMILSVPLLQLLLKSFTYMSYSVLYAVYLAIFESWYRIGTRSKWSENEISIVNVVTSILIISPMFILALYPYITLGFIFWCAFIIIHLIAQTLWFTKIYSHNEKLRKNEYINGKAFRSSTADIRRYRIVFGLLVLGVVILDRIFYSNINLNIQTVITASHFKISDYIQTLISSVILVMLLTPFINFLSADKNQDENNPEKHNEDVGDNTIQIDYYSINGFFKIILGKRVDCLRIQMISLILPLIIPLVTIALLNNTFEQFKVLLTFAGCVFIMIFDVIQMIYFRGLKTKDINK